MRRLEWRLYYADRTTCDSSQVECWEDAPLMGVLFCVNPSDRTGRHVLSSRDYYYRPPSRVWLARQIAVDEDMFVAMADDLTPALQTFAPWIKWGMWAGDKLYDEVARAATYDIDFLPKSAKEPLDARKVP